MLPDLPSSELRAYSSPLLFAGEVPADATVVSLYGHMEDLSLLHRCPNLTKLSVYKPTLHNCKAVGGCTTLTALKIGGYPEPQP